MPVSNKLFKGMNLPAPIKRFLERGGQTDSLLEEIAETFPAYSLDVWGGVDSANIFANMRDIPQMLQDGIVSSALKFIMQSAFQPNEKQQVFWVKSPYSSIVKELDAFHESVNMQNMCLTIAYNLLIWGNLPFRNFFDDRGRFVNFTPIPDFRKITPIMLSGQILGYLVDGQFHLPYEYEYGQLSYYRNLGGIFKNNLVTFSSNSDAVTGNDFQNEFTLAPSYLTGAAKPWRTLNLIEDALLLNRLDQSNYYRIISVGVGTAVHSKAAIKTLNYYRNLFNKVRRVSYSADGMASKGANQAFEIIVPTTSNQTVDVKNIGGEIDVKALKDVDETLNRLFGALQIQPSQIGFGEEEQNAVGDSAAKTYDSRLAHLLKTIIYSVHSVIKQFDLLYLRTRGYDVRDNDFSYGSVSLTSLEDAMRSDTLNTAISSLKSLTETLDGLDLLESVNKQYLVESILGQPLSATGVNVADLFRVEAAEDAGELEPVMTAYDYKQRVQNNTLQTLVVSGILPAGEFTIPDSRLPILSASIRSSGQAVPYSVLTSSLEAFPSDSIVDLAGVVSIISPDELPEDDRARKRHIMAAVDPMRVNLIIPSSLQFTVADFSAHSNLSLGDGYLTSSGGLVLRDKASIVSFLSLKESGLHTAICRSLVVEE